MDMARAPKKSYLTLQDAISMPAINWEDAVSASVFARVLCTRSVRASSRLAPIARIPCPDTVPDE